MSLRLDAVRADDGGGAGRGSAAVRGARAAVLSGVCVGARGGAQRAVRRAARRGVSPRDFQPGVAAELLVGRPRSAGRCSTCTCTTPTSSGCCSACPTRWSAAAGCANGLPEFWHSHFEYRDGGYVVEATSGTIDQQGRAFNHGFEIHLERATLLFEFAVLGGEGRYLCPPTVLDDAGQAADRRRRRRRSDECVRGGIAHGGRVRAQKSGKRHAGRRTWRRTPSDSAKCRPRASRRLADGRRIAVRMNPEPRHARPAARSSTREP